MEIPLTSRLARAATKLTIGAYSINDVQEITAALGDFYRVPMETLDSCSFVKGKWMPRKDEPSTESPFKENAANQILYIRDVFGAHHVEGREEALTSLWNLDGEQPEFPPPSFLIDCRGGEGAHEF